MDHVGEGKNTTLVKFTSSPKKKHKRSPEDGVQPRVEGRVPERDPHGQVLAVLAHRHEPPRRVVAQVEPAEGERLADAIRPRPQPELGAGG